MSRAYSIACVIGNLANVRRHAVYARLGEHFVSEIDHLVATAKANAEEEERKENEND